MFLMFLTRISNFVQIRQFSIRSINLFFMHNFRPQKLELNHLIHDITIDVLFFFKFYKHTKYNKNRQSIQRLDF